MSEYQYYEFQAIDRPPTDRQMGELRAISSRATISRTRFSNYYTFGDLKASPRDLLIRYFDASLFFANWMYVELAFRYPKAGADVKALRRYVAGQSLDVASKGADVVVTMSAERDDFDAEDDGHGWLSSSIALRADIASAGQGNRSMDCHTRRARKGGAAHSRRPRRDWRDRGVDPAMSPAGVMARDNEDAPHCRRVAGSGRGAGGTATTGQPRARSQGTREARARTGCRSRTSSDHLSEAPGRRVAACRGARHQEAPWRL